MSILSRLESLLCGALLAVIAFPVAAVSPQRTFVSASGSDANPCSVALPCRTFGAAITAVVSTGEVIVLDSGGYGAVVINKSVELIAPPGIYAGITASAGTGIQIVSPAQNVAIRGIAINGLGTGQFGIDVQFDTRVIIERCSIANFIQDGLRSGSGQTLSLRDSDIRSNGNNGITITAGQNTIERTTLAHNTKSGADVSAGIVAFADSTVANNSMWGIRVSGTTLITITGGQVLNSGQHGVFLDGSVPSGWIRAAIDRANISSNVSAGLFANANAANAIVQLTVARSLFAENFVGLTGATGGGTAAKVFVSDSVFERNAQEGLSSNGTGAEMTISSNVVTGSGNGVGKFSGGVIYTRQNNTVRDNTNNVVNGPFTILGGV
jgi:hypothetical protein